MDEKNNVLKTIQSYLTAVLINRDVDRASTFLADEIICCDLNTSCILPSKQDVIRNLYEKMNSSVLNNSIYIRDETINLYDQMAVFIGKLVIASKNTVNAPRAVLQYSATLRYDNGWKICASHYSSEDDDANQSWGFTEDNIAGGILSSYLDNGKFPLRSINENLLRLLGYTLDEFKEKYGNDVLKIIYPNDLALVKKEVISCIEKGIDWKLNHRIATKDGRILHMLVRGRKSLDKAGREIVTNFSIDMTDMFLLQQEVANQAEELEAKNEELIAQERQLIAQQKELEAQNEELSAQTDELILQSKELILSEQKFRIALAKTENIIFDYNLKEGTVLLYNLAEPAKDKTILFNNLETELIENEYLCGESKTAFQNMFLHIKNGHMSVKQDIHTITARGKNKWYQFLITAIMDSRGDPVHAIGTAEDITKQMRVELDLRSRAESDLLTGIYNKISLMEKIEERRLTPTDSLEGAFMILDVDSFKSINDIYGHPYGDTILKKVAEVLKYNFRDTDIIGRLGGDEFGIYVYHNRNLPFVEQKAEIINQEIRGIPHPGGNERNITVSIGITTNDGCEKPFEQMYQEADTALYRAKQKGKDTYCFYEN